MQVQIILALAKSGTPPQLPIKGIVSLLPKLRNIHFCPKAEAPFSTSSQVVGLRDLILSRVLQATLSKFIHASRGP
jgi:hypothetical protein